MSNNLRTEETSKAELHTYIQRLEQEILRLRKENRTLRKGMKTLQNISKANPHDTGEFLRQDTAINPIARSTLQGSPLRLLLDPDDVPTPSHESASYMLSPSDTPIPGSMRTVPNPTRPAPMHATSHMGAPLQPSAGTMPQATEDGGFDLGFMNYAGEADLHALPYGLVILDRQGDVLFYNETESKLTGFQRARVEHKNFFRDIAPCTRVKAFEGRFRDFIANKLGPVVFFDFVFRFENGNQFVTIGFSKGRRRGTVNVMMRRRTV